MTTTHTATTCHVDSHDHFGQTEAAANGGEPTPDSDELVCADCGRKMFYDYADDAYHHLTDAERGCFLIPAEAVR